MGFLQFEEIQNAKDKKTKTWAIQNYYLTHLGHVVWHSPWRRYVFAPPENTLFDAECLQDITKFLTAETDKQKETWKK